MVSCPVARGAVRRRLRDRLRLLGGARQIELDRRAETFLAVDLDVAARLLDEAVHHAQSQPGAFADLLGGEERLEHLVAQRGRNAGAGVADRDHDIGSGLRLGVLLRVGVVEHDVAGLQRELAAARHGVARIDREVEHRGHQLAAVDQRRPGLVLEHRLDLDLLAERRPQQARGLDHQGVDVGLVRLQRLLARKGEQLTGQVGAARGRLVDQPRDGGELRPVGDALRRGSRSCR